MIITKMSLPRRTFLRGVGAAIALPLLDAMVPALSAATPARAATSRLLLRAEWDVPAELPSRRERRHDLRAHAGAEAARRSVREHVVVLSGLSNMPVLANDQGGGVHTRNHAGWLSGVLPKRTEGANITSAKTVDQYAADKLGADTPLRSLELTLESNYQVGNCEAGYSCAYLNSTSWRAPNAPLPHEGDPRVVFQRLFGDGGSVAVAPRADAEGPQHPRFGDGERRRSCERRLGASDRTVDGRLPRLGARSRTADSARGARQRDDAAADGRAAVRHPG